MATTVESFPKFKVAEALPKNVGRGIVSLDPGDMTRLGVEIGDVVELGGKRKTVAKVMPAYKTSAVNRGSRSMA